MIVIPPSADPELIAKAREALRQKMEEMNAKPGAQATRAVKPPPSAAAAAAAPAPAAQPSPATAQLAAAPAAAAGFQAAPPSGDAESIAKARENLRQKMDAMEAQKPVSASAPASAASAAPAAATMPAQTQPQGVASKAEVKSKKAAKAPQAFPVIQGPPSSVPADKQQQLAELLRKYKAEEISPEEYHLQRAKLVGAQ
jgi:hypothetical protein